MAAHRQSNAPIGTPTKSTASYCGSRIFITHGSNPSLIIIGVLCIAVLCIICFPVSPVKGVCTFSGAASPPVSRGRKAATAGNVPWVSEGSAMASGATMVRKSLRALDARV